LTASRRLVIRRQEWCGGTGGEHEEGACRASTWPPAAGASSGGPPIQGQWCVPQPNGDERSWLRAKGRPRCEPAALGFATAIVRDDREVTDEDLARLRQHFSEPEVVELVFAVGYQTFASNFAKAFRLTPQGFSR
jgi:alkylhydroperoxidase family enzyme